MLFTGRLIQKPLDNLKPSGLLAQFRCCHIFNPAIGRFQLQLSNFVQGNQELDVQRQGIELNHRMVAVGEAAPDPVAQLFFQADPHMALRAQRLLTAFAKADTVGPTAVLASALRAFGELV
jgi:hypothetical protein